MYKPIKELGQNFLIDNKVARDMVEAVTMNGETDLIEIGPGHGVLTQLLVQQDSIFQKHSLRCGVRQEII
jgi:16S rRNA (adenine1518-N6/adenine1519-N6)-dimethyltransferase